MKATERVGQVTQGPGRGPVKLCDIAQRCGVSQATVSRALRGDRRFVSQKTAARILHMAAELGYDPSRSHGARQLALSKNGQSSPSQLVALFMPQEFQHHNYYLLILRGILDVLMPSRYALVTAYYQPDDEALPCVITRGDVDGAVVVEVPARLTRIVANLRRDPGFGARPAVALFEPVPGCAMVSCDEWMAGHAAADHLLQLGHRHLLHFYDERHAAAAYTNHQRLGGFQRACLAHGIDPATHLHPVSYEDYENLRTDHGPLLTALRACPRPTAVLAPNDYCAAFIVGAISKAGLRVPEDVSVVGFDDAGHVPDERGQNILTTVRLPLEDMGREAARLMLEAVAGRTPGDTRITLPTVLVVRSSTAPPATS